jgi:D-lactate dehydrogenase (cytochrome)
MIVKQEQDAILDYLKDASNMPGGSAERVYIPESEAEVARALAECRSLGLQVTIAGAGTGLAGARVPFGGAVIATSKLNNIIEIDPTRLRATVQPGVILGEFQAEVERHGVFYPPDPTERNCFLGGTVATNSSGARTFKYGPTRDYIERLRILLADGDLLELVRGRTHADGRHLSLITESGRGIEIDLPGYTMPATKHAAGYYVRDGMDAIDLFIGSEGTLGIVTEIEVRLLPLPEALFSGVVFFPEESLTLDFVDEARERSRRKRRGDAEPGEIEARAIEYIDANALEMVRGKFPSIPELVAGGAIWFEQETTSATEEALLGAWYDMIVRHGALADDSWFAIGGEDQQRMRRFRHAIPEAVYEYITEHGQTKIGTDMAVPDEAFRELLAFYREEFAAKKVRNVIYGHIGNCHLHANIFADAGEELTQARALYDRLVDKAIDLGGTISAEHGVGKLKKRYLTKLYGEEGVAAMRAVKQALDPMGILGTGTMM